MCNVRLSHASEIGLETFDYTSPLSSSSLVSISPSSSPGIPWEVYIALCGRIEHHWNPSLGGSPIGYCLGVNGSHWILVAASTQLLLGELPLGNGASLYLWHSLALAFSGDRILGLFNGNELFETTDTQFLSGLAAVASGWHIALFDNFQLLPAPSPQGNADTVFNLTSLSAIEDNSFEGSVGASLSVHSGIIATSLARYFVFGNNGTHNLEITDAESGSLIVSATIIMDPTQVDDFGFIWITLSDPVELLPGYTYYLTSSETAGGDLFYGGTTFTKGKVGDWPNLESKNPAISINGPCYFNDFRWHTFEVDSSAFGPLNLRVVAQ
jgi:hypothetical protein